MAEKQRERNRFKKRKTAKSSAKRKAPLKAVHRVLLLTGIVFAMTGLGMMAAGGLCIEFEGGVWALSLFLIGLLVAFAGIVLIVVSVPLERKYAKARGKRGRAISANSFVIGRTVLTFLNEGMYICKGREEVFEECKIIVPYSAIKAYSTTKRRRPNMYGQELIYVKMPACFLKEGKSGNVAYTLEANKKFERLLDKHGAEVFDTRGEPSARPKRMKSFELSGYRRKRSMTAFFGWGATVFCALAFLGLWVICSRSAVAGSLIAVTGALTGAFTACAGYFNNRERVTVCHNGLYWKDGLSNVSFLPWAEVHSVSCKPCGNGNLVVFDCGYSYRGIWNDKGFYEFIKEKFPEKCEGSDE